MERKMQTESVQTLAEVSGRDASVHVAYRPQPGVRGITRSMVEHRYHMWTYPINSDPEKSEKPENKGIGHDRDKDCTTEDGLI